MVSVNPVFVTEVVVELSVQDNTFVPPMVSPMAYSYFWIPLKESLNPVQVEVREDVLLVQSRSTAVLSVTFPAVGAAVSTITPSEIIVVETFSALSVALTLI